jgi:two-component system CheB/CheR fusion protein
VILAVQNAMRLVAAVRELSLARTQDAVMAIVRHEARELTGADGATFVLRDGDQCFYADEEAISPLWKGQRFPLSLCVSGWVMLNRQHVLIEDIYADPRVPADAYRPTFVKSLAMVPIRPEAPIGAIGAYWANRHAPSTEALTLLQALADAASITMENLALYAALEARVEELDRSNRAKDEFLATLSHELRTPLNGIVGWAELLRTGRLEEADRRLALDTIQHNAKVQSRIIDDLLDTTRIVTGKLVLEKKPLDLIKNLQLAVDSVRVLAQAKSQRLELTLPPGPIGAFSGDPDRVQQALWNVLGNAIKFTPRGGRIQVVLERSGPSARIDVSDDGEGIAPEVMPYIFDRFRQADGSITRRHGGLGLGLAIARHLVEAHGGKIAATSEGLGKGSTFSVWLPLLSISDTAGAPSGGLSRRLLDGVRVLAVDDDPGICLLVGTALRQYGAEVRTAELASEAFAMLAHFRADLLVCDISMPVEDGYSLIRRIRSAQIHADGRLAAIALTAFADKEHEDKAYAAGFDGFLGKPLHIPTLATIAASFLPHLFPAAADPSVGNPRVFP